MKNIYTLILLLILSPTLFAGQIDKATAKTVARNFYYERINQFEPIAHSIVKINEIFQIKEDAITLIYVFNISGGGFVMVSGIDQVRPVPGYSLSGKYSDIGQPPQFMDLLDQYKKQISYAYHNDGTVSPEIRKMWEHLSSGNPATLNPLRDDKAVEPLLSTQWNQGQYYNEMCPADPAGPGGHCYAGCVATALGQLVNYFRWPLQGIGSYSYQCPPYGTLTADFGNTNYEWNQMATSLNKSNLAVALLLYHLGIACDMVYGPNGSGMYNHKAAYALRTFFKYSPETVYVYRDSTSMDWDSLLVTHLDQSIPMYYAGWSLPNINGHAFVCDGYQADNYYHFNWGWGGSYDGYFYTDELSPGGSNFNLAQELIINGFPDTNTYSYPYYCQGDQVLNSTDGSIDDGSGPVYDYLTNSDCSWLIAPVDSVENITLEFLKFHTDAGDLVTVYDGETIAAPVLGTFQGPDIPDNITSSGDRMLITFSSDGTLNAPGWLLSFSSEIPVYCSGMTNLSAQADTISDGSGPRDYHNGSACMWMITPPDASELSIYFISFNTEETFDLVKIYDAETQDLLAVYSGDIVPAPVTSPSGSMFVTFSSNYTITAPGWEAYYETDLVKVKEKNIESSLQIFPNPAKDKVNLSWMAETGHEITISVSSMSGNTMISLHKRSKQGRNLLEIDVSGLPVGIYLLEMANGKDKVYRKVVVE